MDDDLLFGGSAASTMAPTFVCQSAVACVDAFYCGDFSLDSGSSELLLNLQTSNNEDDEDLLGLDG
jgi:hypothetical protein